jgi:hypothetical protein
VISVAKTTKVSEYILIDYNIRHYPCPGSFLADNLFYQAIFGLNRTPCKVKQMKKLKCAVIGTGYLGKFHAEKYALL